MKTFVPMIAAGFCLAVSPMIVSPAAAEYLFYRNSSVLDDHREFGVPLSRLDRDDLARERARAAEHQRIHTRLGDPRRGMPSRSFRRTRAVPGPASGHLQIARAAAERHPQVVPTLERVSRC